MELENLATEITIDKIAIEAELEIEDIEEILDELGIEPIEQDGDEYDLSLADALLLKDETENWKGEYIETPYHRASGGINRPLLMR